MVAEAEEYRAPRTWWTTLNRGAFDPLFESRDDAIIFFGPGKALMRVIEQPENCEA